LVSNRKSMCNIPKGVEKWSNRLILLNGL
jgi:hypothetical protein